MYNIFRLSALLCSTLLSLPTSSVLAQTSNNLQPPSDPIHEQHRILDNMFATGDWATGNSAAIQQFFWGCTTMPLPGYLWSESLPVAPQHGRLVISVEPGSPSCLAGLSAGQLIIAIDGQPWPAHQELPCLDRSRCLTVFSDAGLNELSVAPQSVNPIANALKMDGLGLLPTEIRAMLQDACALESQLTGPQLVIPAPGNCDSPEICGERNNAIRSLAVSQANGSTVVCAVVDTADGAVRVELTGTPEEIQRQLAQLSPEIQQALSPSLNVLGAPPSPIR